MSERDDALRRQLGWTGPEETDYEPTPAPIEPTFTPASTPLPSRPPVDLVPADTAPEPPAPEPREPEPPAPERDTVFEQHAPEPPAPDRPAPPPREPERPPTGGLRPPPPRYGPPPPRPFDTGQFSAIKPQQGQPPQGIPPPPPQQGPPPPPNPQQWFPPQPGRQRQRTPLPPPTESGTAACQLARPAIRNGPAGGAAVNRVLCRPVRSRRTGPREKGGAVTWLALGSLQDHVRDGQPR